MTLSLPRAAQVLQSVLAREIVLDGGRTLRFVIRDSGSVVIGVLDEGRLADAKEQTVALLPTRSELDIDEERYRAFAEGVRLAAEELNPDLHMPRDYLLVNALRVPSLCTAADFAHVIARREVQRRLLGPLEVRDDALARGLAPISHPIACDHVWTLLKPNGNIDAALAAARALVAADCLEAAPQLIGLVEDWQARMWDTGGISWLTDDARNADVMLARVLYPLLRKATDDEQRRQLAALEAIGMFDEEHETTLHRWMFDT